MASVLTPDGELGEKIRGYLDGFMQGVLEVVGSIVGARARASREERGEWRPFHNALLPPAILAMHDFERMFSTKLGSAFEQCGLLIARAYHGEAQRQAVIQGDLPLRVSEQIERFVAGLARGNYRGLHRETASRFAQMATEVGEAINRRVQVDLRVVNRRGEEMLFEIKSPKPNKGQCAEATQRLLLCHAIRRGAYPKLQTYYAMAYNPWGRDRSKYSHGFALQYLDMDEQVLVGDEFWDILGGTGTGKALLRLYREVGQTWRGKLIEALEGLR